jgi:hypothetical protein
VLLTSAVAVFVAVIGFEQWWTARNKFKLDLFDRRWAVYIATRDLLSQISSHGRTSPEEQVKFLEGIRGAKWLFNERIDKYLNKDLRQKILYLDEAYAMLDAPPMEREAAAKQHEEIMEWVRKQYEDVDLLFDEFLQMDTPLLHWIRSRWETLTRHRP